MQNSTKRIPAVTTTVSGQLMLVVFADGQTAEINTDLLSDEIRVIAMMHGLNAKLVDAAAIGRDSVTGKSASLSEKRAAVLEIVERLTGDNPSWNKIREGGSNGGVNNGLLLRAIMEVSGKTYEETRTFLLNLSAEQKAAIRARERVANVIARMQREKLAAVDVSDEFDDFLGGEDTNEDSNESDEDESDNNE
jgi:hypothetical protein